MKITTEKAIEIIKSGGIVIFPTDTAYGIGCRIDNKDSVTRLFKIRKRPINMPTPVLVSSIDMALEYYADYDHKLVDIMKKYWPGGLTIIAKAKDNVNNLLLNNQGCIGIRMPDHYIPLKLIKSVGMPLIGTSANFHGDQTPYVYSDLNPELVKISDGVIAGDCEGKQASTVIDYSDKIFKIKRPGLVKIKL